MITDLSKALKIIAIVNLLVAVGVVVFWIGFFTEILFPIAELRPLIHNFDGYYAWEKCFVVPDVLAAITTFWAAMNILRNKHLVANMMLLAACSGAWIFLGVLDFTYGISNNMYTLGHWFSYILLEIGIGLPIIGISTLYVLRTSLIEETTAHQQRS